MGLGDTSSESPRGGGSPSHAQDETTINRGVEPETVAKTDQRVAMDSRGSVPGSGLRAHP
jgi:hypothetical protein